MKKIMKFRTLLIVLVFLLCGLNAKAISLWVGQSYTWDFSGAVMGSTYNMSVSSNGGYLSITGSGFYRTITPTQFFGGTVTVTAEWDYTMYYGDTLKHQKVTVTISCIENPVSIHPTSVTLSPGETYQLGYSHAYDNQYVGAANAYFSGGNSSFSVTSSGLITAKSPGSGYVNVYSKVSNAANAPYCHVTVKDVEPTGATISDISVLADQSTDLKVNVTPSNASVKSKQWYVKTGSDIVSISGQKLTGLKPGTATIYCMVNGSVRSNDAKVTVTEPKLTNVSTIPDNNASDVSVFVSPSATYSHSLYKGNDYDAISLTENGARIEGEVEMTDKTIRFLPTKPLKAHTTYTLSIPRNAVKNKWGSSAQSDVSLSFSTGSLEKATVIMTPVSGSFLTKDERVTITASPSDAQIYFTMDGSNPTLSSQEYTQPIKSDNDFTIKAFAVREGYEDSEVVTAQYYKSQSEILSYYPNDTDPLFNYSWVAPYLKLSGPVEKSNNFRRISLTDDSGNEVEGGAYITNNMVVFVPEGSLNNCTKYTLDIPRDALKTTNGEVFKGFAWSFTTPTLPTDVAMQGDASVFVLSENGVLKTRGLEYLTTNTANGGFTYKDYDTLSNLLTGVNGISGGYTHKMVHSGSSAAGYGFSLCSETGTTSNIASIGSVKLVKAGFQTSAIISEDNALWMCGRNDFYQLGDSTGTTATQFIKIADNIIDVALGNGFTLYVDSDNVLWGVGRNHLGQLGDGTRINRKVPVKIMDGVSKVFVSATGFFSACITTDDKLLTWGDNSVSQLGREADKYSSTPGTVLDNVIFASLGGSHALAIKENCNLYAWGSNAHGQIAKTGGQINKPTLIAENVMSVCAGPNTTLILKNSGKVTGWGLKTHNNFGNGEGNASEYVVHEGNAFAPLQSVSIEPYKFEVLPESSFALVAIPNPLASDFETVDWISDHPDVASIDGNGVIRTGAIGEAIITVKLTDRFGNYKTAEATIICTENPDNTGVQNAYVDSSDWYAYSSDNNVIIGNAHEGSIYTVYNVQGMIIGRIMAESSKIEIPVNQSGVYVVRSGSKAVKVICDK